MLRGLESARYLVISFGSMRKPVLLKKYEGVSAHILRAQHYLKRRRKFVEQEFRILGNFSKACFFTQWITLIKASSWFDLCKKYFHTIKGINGRMEGFQGAVLRVKLKYLDEWTEARRTNARKYNELLKTVDIITPFEEEFNRHVYHLYVIRTTEREKLQNYLMENGVYTGIHYPIPIHLQESYKDLGYSKGDFPVTEKTAEEILSLPMFPELNDEQIEYVCKQIKSF